MSTATPALPPLPSHRCSHCTAILALFLWGALVGSAVPFSLGNTEVRDLPPSANGRSYTLYIGLPASYATSPNRRYPVLYACDGYWDFQVLTAEVGNLNYDNAVPECIVVGIAYSGTSPDVGSLRQWDLTPGYDPYAGVNSGHADDFLNVIAGQFIPFVESNYRVDASFRVLSGHSYGGLFTVYAMFARPGLFQSYIAGSPSLWWRGNFLLSTERDYAQTHTSFPARLFLTFGADESYSIQGSTQAFANQIRNSHYANFALAIRKITGERHAGTKGETFNRGLRFAFAPLAPSPSTALDPGFGSPPTLISLSTRGRVSGGENVLIAGLVIDGLTPKRLLIRAVGPALGSAGVVDFVADPKFTVFDSNHSMVASNDNWGDAADQPALFASFLQTGAFLFSTGSRDAASLVTLNPGLFTIVVEGVNGAQGVALVEAYELPP